MLALILHGVMEVTIGKRCRPRLWGWPRDCARGNLILQHNLKQQPTRNYALQRASHLVHLCRLPWLSSPQYLDTVVIVPHWLVEDRGIDA